VDAFDARKPPPFRIGDVRAAVHASRKPRCGAALAWESTGS
jgi:hypothetical protein